MKIAIIGCGNMGAGLAQRLSQTHQLFLYNPTIEKAEKLSRNGFGKVCSTIEEAIRLSELVILAIKPQNLTDAAGLIAGHLNGSQTIVSLLAGTPIYTLRSHFPNVKIVRMMPNLALIYGEGVIGLSADETISNEYKEELTKTFELLGKIYWMPENKIDALTALAGSGPAFFFAIIESMIDSGIAMGIASKESQEIVYQMLQGSLTLLKETHKHPGELKWQITSPGGTTIAGLKRLEEQGLRGNVINTFLAAYERARELSAR